MFLHHHKYLVADFLKKFNTDRDFSHPSPKQQTSPLDVFFVIS